MTDLLEKILAVKKREVAAAKNFQPAEILLESLEATTRDFKAALRTERTNLPKIIAEIKRRSPSKPQLKPALQVAELAKIYDKQAAAISVLTDREFFGGSLEDLSLAEEISKLPLLRKDFIFDEYQILEARLMGASAVLLITRILQLSELRNLIARAREFKMEPLVEVTNEAEIERALQAGAEIIGINNRDLGTLKIEPQRTLTLSKKVPAEKIIVAESGFESPAEVKNLQGVVDAVLIGTAILQAPDPTTFLAELTGSFGT